MRLFIIILTSAFLFISTALFAVEISGLYSAEQRVATQDESARDAVAGKALASVLLKVVGDSAQLASLSDADIAAVAPKLIERHQYYNANAANARHDNTAPEQLAVRLHFDAHKVNQQISDWGLPIWNKSRPAVLLLLVKDSHNNRQVLAEDDALAKLADEVATLRGIPILIPLMDLADQKTLDMTRLWAGEFDATAAFETRYQTPVAVTARMVVQDNEQWLIQWQYNLAGAVSHWQSHGDGTHAIQTGVAQLADNLARQFSHAKTAESQRFLLEIEDVLGFVSHQKVISFLSDLNYADRVQQQALIDGVLTVSLDYFGNKQALASVISSEPLLMPLSDIIGADRLYYRVRH